MELGALPEITGGQISKINSLTVVLPVFNEESVIEESVLALVRNLQAICTDYEIVVVDDGSTDATAQILERLVMRVAGLRLFHNATNRGLGGALQRGFAEAGKPLVFYTDADMPFQYSEILVAAQKMEASGADMVAGFRVNRELESPVRRACSMAYNGCVRLIYGVQLRDINCAFKLVRLNVLRKIELKAGGSFIDAEMVVKASYCGFRIEEFGVEYHPRQEGDSRLFRFYPIMNAFFEMAKLYPDILRIKRIEKKPEKSFDRSVH
ncbi:MAG: glycosyltransferase family 2 protein [Candidatus Omnitrophica bacterium]|nr:glycosyltransferase family 2 protein [Candidatus Omnitrophota bacterium]